MSTVSISSSHRKMNKQKEVQEGYSNALKKTIKCDRHYALLPAYPFFGLNFVEIIELFIYEER